MSKLICTVLPLLTFAHTFRKDRVTHVVVTSRAKIRRDGTHHTLCAKRVDRTFQRRVSSGTVIAPVDCDRCAKSMSGILDLMERHES